MSSRPPTGFAGLLLDDERMRWARSGALAIAISMTAGFTLAIGGTKLAMAFIALAIGLIIVQTISARILLTVFVTATFVTRYRIDVGGFQFLPEHFIAFCLILRVAIEGTSSAIWQAMQDRTVLLLAAFIIWEAVISFFQAPDPSASFRIIGWLAIDWVILVAVLASRPRPAYLERLTAKLSLVLALIAVLLWLAFAFLDSTIGTQGGYASEGRAVFGLSWEANILASTLAVWGFIALSSRDTTVQRIARFGTPIIVAAIAVSYTRSAIVGLALALIIWIASGDRRATGKVTRIGAIVFGAAVIVSFVPQVASPIEKRFTQVFEFNSGTAAFRTESIETAVGDLHGSGPLVGLGVESFGQRHTDPTRPGEARYIGALPFQVLYESGLIGLVLLGAALASLRPFARDHAGRALAVLAVYLVTATATSPFWFGWTWILIALAVMTRPMPSQRVGGRRDELPSIYNSAPRRLRQG